MNLLNETNEKLELVNKTWDDVVGIIVWDKQISKDNFKKISDEEYDNGYGGSEVPMSLKIVGKDWWLERAEYDGAEWWEFKKMPVLSNFEEDTVSKEDFWDTEMDW